MARGRPPTSLDLPVPTGLSSTDNTTSKQEVAYAALRDSILGGVLGDGLRMPSTRALALRWNLSRGTVEAVYERLSSEGYLSRQQGAGTFVSATIPDSYLTAQKVTLPIGEPVANCQNGSTHQKNREPAEVSVRVGAPFVARLPDPDLFPLIDWSRQAAKAVAASRTRLEGRTDPAGLPSLRSQIAGYLRQFRNIDCAPEDILMTTGIRHALDLICRSFISAGDKVCVEDPCYPFARRIFALSGAVIEHVPVQRDGIRTNALRQHSDAKLVYVTPAHQSPLGITMSVSRRLELLEWAQMNGAVIIEDDYDSEFSYSGAPLPALMSIDRSGQTIYCGSFNKTIFSDMRIGFVVAKGEVRHRLSDIWQLIGRSTALAEQVALERYIGSGAFARHLRIARHAYVQRRDCLLNLLDTHAHGLFSVSGHEAGFHFVLWLKNGQSEAEFCASAARAGIVLQPLSAFCHDTKLPPAAIVGYTALTLPQIEEAGLKLAAVLAGN